MDFDLETKADENFFGALKRHNTNLGHLFEHENQGVEQKDSLKYQPMTVTELKSPATTSKNLMGATTTTSPITTVQAWQTLLAKVAQAYKGGVPVGKVGVALLQNVEKDCRIIIYKAKLNVLSTCSLRADMPQVHRRNNYLQFYDDDFLCWSIYFDADANTEEFVAKLNELKIEVKTDDEQKTASQELTTDSEYVADEKSELCKSRQLKIIEVIEKPPIIANKPTKSALITRMTKMGGQALPKLPPLPPHVQSSVDATDSSDTETISTRMALAPTHHKHQPTPRNSNRALAKPQVLPVSELSYVAQPAAAVGAFESQFMQMMLTENRTHNCELRMNVGKLESKVDKVLDKIDLLRSSAVAKSGHKEDELIELEEKVLELKKENRRLRQAIEENPHNTPTPSCEQILQMYSAELAAVNLNNIDSLERLVGDLLRQRASLHEKLEQWERDLALKNIELKSHQTRLDDDEDMLAKTIAKNEHLEVEIKSYQKRLIDKEKLECDLRHQLAESNKECIVQRQQYEECKHMEMKANDLIAELRAQKQKLQLELDEKSRSEMVIRENHKSRHEAAIEDDYSNPKLPIEKQIETVLKKTMNNLYANLAIKLENIVPMQKNAIIAIVGKTIREETLRAMDELKK
ncbi:FK506-binding protein 15 [Eurosta solidaginis]|uniref:FK506-binding protein 15 n=1 Tax=Eurosta solidaginis TaxID=178769 RepID=UPI003530C0FE